MITFAKIIETYRNALLRFQPCCGAIFFTHSLILQDTGGGIREAHPSACGAEGLVVSALPAKVHFRVRRRLFYEILSTERGVRGGGGGVRG